VNEFLADQREAKRLLTSEFGLGNINPQTVYREYERLLRNEYENYGEIRKVFDDAVKLGHSKRKILKDYQKRFTKNDLGIILSGTYVPDDFGTILKDTRLTRTLRERGLTLREFIDPDRMREIRDKYNGRKFSERMK
jgi:hypothetical protein